MFSHLCDLPLATFPPSFQPQITPLMASQTSNYKPLKVTIRLAHQALTSISFTLSFSKVNFNSNVNHSTTKSGPLIHPTPLPFPSHLVHFSSISKRKIGRARERKKGSFVCPTFVHISLGSNLLYCSLVLSLDYLGEYWFNFLGDLVDESWC